MDSKKKKMVLFLGSMLVAIMFLTGIAGLGGGGGVPSSNAPTAAHKLHITNTFLAVGIVNATVYGYGSSIKLVLYNDSYANYTAAVLTSMESNGSITTFTQSPEAFQLYAGKYDAYQVYLKLANNLGSSNFSFSVPEYVRLSPYAKLSVRNTTIEVNTSLEQDYQLYANLTKPNSTVETKVMALVGILNNTYVLVPNNVTVTGV